MTSELVSTAIGAASPTIPSFEFEPHNCFACGSLNEHGLQLDLHLGDGRSWTELELPARFEGWVGIAHGGILATLLDEVMAWALVAQDNWGVTARLAVDFRRPVPIGQPIRAEGWIVRTRRRLVDTAGQVVGSDGTILARAEAVYLAVDEVRKRELQARYGYRMRAARDDTQAADRGAGAATPGPVDAR
ncbi:MAG: PaaI family thioesterase [Chloroflexota bacterium]